MSSWPKFRHAESRHLPIRDLQDLLLKASASITQLRPSAMSFGYSIFSVSVTFPSDMTNCQAAEEFRDVEGNEVHDIIAWIADR
jgi:hypothetical protein